MFIYTLFVYVNNFGNLTHINNRRQNHEGLKSTGDPPEGKFPPTIFLLEDHYSDNIKFLNECAIEKYK